MKQFSFILALIILVNFDAKCDGSRLIPQPVHVEVKSGFYTISNSTTICINTSQCMSVANLLANKIAGSTGFDLPVKIGAKGDIRFELYSVVDERLGDEGYILKIDSKGVVIRANKPAGLYYGMQTMLQLLPPEIESGTVVSKAWKIPAVEITDYPRFKWRGIMLDVSRHFFTKEEVKKIIDQISRLKFNTFHWHLSDDNGWRIEIKSLPKLTDVGAWRVERNGQFGKLEPAKPGEPATYGGYYTHDDIREVVAFAAERNVTIVPEIDIPGHCMAAIAAYPELCCTQDTSIKVNPGTPFSEWYADGTFKMLIDNTLNPSDEKVYEFLDKVFTEVAQLFPVQYIHAGGDECYKGYWKNDPGCKALLGRLNSDDPEDLQTYFMNRVSQILKSKGKKLIGWDADNELPEGATVMSWRGFKAGAEAAKAGHYAVMAPNQHCYLDYQQGEETIEPPVYAALRLKSCYQFEPVPDGIDSKFILGGQGNLWTENIPTLSSIEYMFYPRTWALAEVLWSPKSSRDWDDFRGRVGLQFQRADVAGINYSRAIYDPIITIRKKADKLWLEMEGEATGIDIFYSVDCTMPTHYSPMYTYPVELPNGPITLRVIAYRDNLPIGNLITLSREELEKRAVSSE